jgi:putative exporter of polyketide antibiotics
MPRRSAISRRLVFSNPLRVNSSRAIARIRSRVSPTGSASVATAGGGSLVEARFAVLMQPLAMLVAAFGISSAMPMRAGETAGRAAVAVALAALGLAALRRRDMQAT